MIPLDNKQLRWYRKDGKFELVSVDEAISRGLNKWKGWKCSVGVRALYIDYDGGVWVGNCASAAKDRYDAEEWEPYRIKADYLAAEILEAEDQELLERFSSWYIAERNPRYLKRNALVSIGNSKETENELFKSLLMKYLRNSDPLLRSHAAWASIRLGHKDLVDLAKNDSDPLVLKEIMLAEVEGFI